MHYCYVLMYVPCTNAPHQGRLGDLMGEGLRLRVLDRDWVSRDDSLGELTVPLQGRPARRVARR